MTIFELIDSTEDIKSLRKIFNNLPDVKLHPSGVDPLSVEEIQLARDYALEKINELKGHV